MKKTLLCLMLLSVTYAYSQKPVIKVDINYGERSLYEVNEPGYQPWSINLQSSDKKEFNGVSITIASTEGGLLNYGWQKEYVQAPYYARLANDGISSEKPIQIIISGLPLGKNSIQTYHNTWTNPKEFDYCPLNVYLNGKLIHKNITRTNRVTENCNATCLFTEIDVKQINQTDILVIEPVKKFKAKPGKTAENSVSLNGFEVNTPDIYYQAYKPYPQDADIHADADAGNLTLSWKAARKGNAVKHKLYIGTDYKSVSNSTRAVATLNSEILSYKLNTIYSMNTYYWRVDEVDKEGKVTPGNVWSFRPRQPAFRDAEGYGRFATGGRGGKVVVVTNLNDDGPGSLREAVTGHSGPRTIVFNVSGLITLKSRLVMNSGFITLAGQTAPGKGICIRSAPLGVGPETICRFIRSRLGAGKTFDGLGMAGANHSIIDHCSVSWTIDEAFSSRNAKNMTLQRTLISEALNIAGHQNYPEGTGHGYAATIGGDIASFHHNLLAHCSGRNWSLGGGLDGSGHYAGRLDIFNNVVYNWGTRATDGGAHEVNFHNNYYKKGAATSQNTILLAQLEGVGKGSQSYYYSGNVIANPDGSIACDGTDNTCGRAYKLYNNQAKPDWQVFVDKPFFPSQAEVQTANDAYKSVLSDVGCTMPIIDDHDKRILKETITGTYTFVGSKTAKGKQYDAEFKELSEFKKGGIIDHQDDAGGYEDYPEISRPADFDSDLDGLPDWWELIYKTNPNSSKGDFSDANSDKDKDGYTSLEDYLEWMSVPHFTIPAKKEITINLDALAAGYNAPKFTILKASGFKAIFKSDTEVVIISENNVPGIQYADFTVTDKDGSKTQRRVGLLTGVQN